MKYRNLILAIATVSSFAVAQVSSANAGGLLAGGLLGDLLAPGVGTESVLKDLGRPTCCFGPCWPKSEIEHTREMRDRWLRPLRDQGIIVD